jgi:hypothetical protein
MHETSSFWSVGWASPAWSTTSLYTKARSLMCLSTQKEGGTGVDTAPPPPFHYDAASGTRSPRRLRGRARGKPYFLIVAVVAVPRPNANPVVAGPSTAAHQVPTTPRGLGLAPARLATSSTTRLGFRPRKRDQRTHGSSGKNCERPTAGDGAASQTARQLVYRQDFLPSPLIDNPETSVTSLSPPFLHLHAPIKCAMRATDRGCPTHIGPAD